jgi:hypothetical protein
MMGLSHVMYGNLTIIIVIARQDSDNFLIGHINYFVDFHGEAKTFYEAFKKNTSKLTAHTATLHGRSHQNGG